MKAVEEYLSGKDSAVNIVAKYDISCVDVLLRWVHYIILIENLRIIYLYGRFICQQLKEKLLWKNEKKLRRLHCP